MCRNDNLMIGAISGGPTSRCCAVWGACPDGPCWPRGQALWQRQYRTCAIFSSAKVEDIHHFVMECPAYAAKRVALLQYAIHILASSHAHVSPADFIAMTTNDQLAILLGKRISDPKAEDRLDRNVKRFLSKCWNARSEVTGAVNDALFTSYGIYSAIAA